MKKILSFVLCAVMVLSVLPNAAVTTFAYETTQTQSLTPETATLQADGIVADGTTIVQSNKNVLVIKPFQDDYGDSGAQGIFERGFVYLGQSIAEAYGSTCTVLEGRTGDASSYEQVHYNNLLNEMFSGNYGIILFEGHGYNSTGEWCVGGDSNINNPTYASSVQLSQSVLQNYITAHPDKNLNNVLIVTPACKALVNQAYWNLFTNAGATLLGSKDNLWSPYDSPVFGAFIANLTGFYSGTKRSANESLAAAISVSPSYPFDNELIELKYPTTNGTTRGYTNWRLSNDTPVSNVGIHGYCGTKVSSGIAGQNVAFEVYKDTDSDIVLRIFPTSRDSTRDYRMYEYQKGAGPWVFYGSIIDRYVIENGVTSVSDRAFFSCSSLEEIVVPDSVTSIGYYSFGNYTAAASNLRSISFGRGLVTIGDNALSNAKITSLVIPNSVVSIGAYAFFNNACLESIDFGTSLTSIGYGAFACDPMITSLVIPDSVTNLGECAFYGCANFENVLIGSGINTIESFCFENCTKLKSVYFKSAPTTLVADAFSGDTPTRYYLNGGTVDLTEGTNPTPTKEVNGTYYVFNGYYDDSDTLSTVSSDTDGVNDGNIAGQNRDVYAKWVQVQTVQKDLEHDTKITDSNTYKSFENIGVQKRLRYEENGDQQYPEGLRFVTVFDNDLVERISQFNSDDDTVQYGYTIAPRDTFDATYGASTAIRSGMTGTTDIDCTKGHTYTDEDSQTVTMQDHNDFGRYRMFTFVITYDNSDEAAKFRQIIARPYIRYKDSQGVWRYYYFDYGSNGGTSVHKGCCASFHTADYQYNPVKN